MGDDLTYETTHLCRDHIKFQKACMFISHDLDEVAVVRHFSCPQHGCAVLGLGGTGRLRSDVHSGSGVPEASSVAVPTEQHEFMQLYL